MDLHDPCSVANHHRARVRSLALAQAAAFEMIYYHVGGAHRAAGLTQVERNRLSYFSTLLADVAWVNGARNAHEGEAPVASAEVEAVLRVYRPRTDTRRQHLMSEEQRTAVLGYLDAVLSEAEQWAELDEAAPSRTLARESRRFTHDLATLRQAAEDA